MLSKLPTPHISPIPHLPSTPPTHPINAPSHVSVQRLLLILSQCRRGAVRCAVVWVRHRGWECRELCRGLCQLLLRADELLLQPPQPLLRCDRPNRYPLVIYLILFFNSSLRFIVYHISIIELYFILFYHPADTFFCSTRNSHG